MLLRGIRLQNYRAFVGEVNVSLRPLTLLFGYNSAGKSALLRALPLIAESIHSKKGPLAVGEGAARGGNFRDIRTRWSPVGRLRFGLDWADGDTSLDVELADLARTQRQVIETFRLRDAVHGDLRFELDIADERAADITTYTCDGERGSIVFDGWIPARVEGFAREDATARLQAAGRALKRVADAVHWISALRAQPRRDVPLIGSKDSIAEDGTGTFESLARESLAPSSDVLQDVSAWFQKATKHTLTVRQQAAGDTPLFHVELVPLLAPHGIHLADTGEGMAQVLPVITLGALAMAGRLGEAPILAIENPEMHLHPRAHADVADYLVAVAKHATVVVETHSENFMLAVQLAIARGQIDPNDIIIHWVSSTEEGPSFVKTITLDDKARPSAWPPGVFAEDRELAHQLIAKRHGRPSS
jgi:AAA ATPase domain